MLLSAATELDITQKAFPDKIAIPHPLATLHFESHESKQIGYLLVHQSDQACT